MWLIYTLTASIYIPSVSRALSSRHSILLTRSSINSEVGSHEHGVGTVANFPESERLFGVRSDGALAIAEQEPPALGQNQSGTARAIIANIARPALCSSHPTKSIPLITETYMEYIHRHKNRRISPSIAKMIKDRLAEDTFCVVFI